MSRMEIRIRNLSQPLCHPVMEQPFILCGSIERVEDVNLVNWLIEIEMAKFFQMTFEFVKSPYTSNLTLPMT